MEAAPSFSHQVIFSTMYGTGVRVSEALHLQVPDRWKACPGKPIRANVIEESVLGQVTSHCRLGKRHRQEHVGALLHHLLKRVRYDGQNSRVALEFQLAAGMDGVAPLTYILHPPEKPNPDGRGKTLPRLTRLLALAVKCDGLVRSGAIPDYAELARRGWVTRARITQIMNLLHLAAPIQEEILHWPAGTSQRDPVSERALRRLTRIPSWPKQLELWRQLLPGS